MNVNKNLVAKSQERFLSNQSDKPIIKNINRLIARYSPILNADLNHNEYFRIKCVFAVYRKKRIPQINISTHVSSKIY